MTAKQHPLFVYGTLLRGESAHGLVADSLQHIEPASVSDAVLYSLGAYPMLVDGEGTVTGELLWFQEDGYSEVITRLDRYEGPQYARLLRTARTISSQGIVDVVGAWVYVGTGLPDSAIPWPSGDWRISPETPSP
jgi:gamma-glutamylcyclotransferase (GGCT)/AIG2-like uncharacterized protein YtfP